MCAYADLHSTWDAEYHTVDSVVVPSNMTRDVQSRQVTKADTRMILSGVAILVCPGREELPIFT